MRRMMLSMSQEKLGDALSLTFQQIQKYEKGTNRIAASRLQHLAQILQVSPAFFFDGAPGQKAMDDSASSPDFVSDFLATSDGLALVKAFSRLTHDNNMRRRIVALVEELADGSAPAE